MKCIILKQYIVLFVYAKHKWAGDSIRLGEELVCMLMRSTDDLCTLLTLTLHLSVNCTYRAHGGPSARSGHKMVACNKYIISFGGFHDNSK